MNEAVKLSAKPRLANKLFYTMNNTNKYILELETKLQSYQTQEKQWEKEQSASITLFKEKEQQISNLNASLNTLNNKLEVDKEKVKEITNKSKEQ